MPARRTWRALLSLQDFLDFIGKSGRSHPGGIFFNLSNGIVVISEMLSLEFVVKIAKCPAICIIEGF